MKRQSNESYTDCRVRRTAENDRIDAYLKGRYAWISRLPQGYKGELLAQGTMRKPTDVQVALRK
mgnify:CR=1 FL=1